MNPWPFVGSHVANYALNKEVGLILLHSKPQVTPGYTSVSEESLLIDQLQIAICMLSVFLDGEDEESESMKPWIAVPEWRPNAHERKTDPLETAKYGSAFDEIQSKAQALGEGLWSNSPEARNFLIKLSLQLHECLRYLNRRVEAVKLCARVMGYPRDSHEAALEMVSRGPELARELDQSYSSLGPGLIGISMAYLAIKSGKPALRYFAENLLKLAREVLTSEAVRRGYVQPIESKKSPLSTKPID